jgi:hypothetical protein
MSSLTNQNANTKSMTGLSDTYSTNIVANSVEVLDEFIVDDGATITLPANSIQDSYLSTNVALLNRTPQTFTGQNYFNANTTLSNGAFLYFTAPTGGTQSRLRQSTVGFDIINMNISQSINFQTRTAVNALVVGFQCQNGNTAFMQGDLNNRITITGATTPTISTQAPALSNDLSIANTAWINTKLGGYALLTPTANPQIFTGNQKFQNVGSNLPISIGSTTAGITSSGGLFIAPGAGSYNGSVGSGDLVLISTGTGNGTGTLTLTSWSNTPVGLKISPTSSTFIGSVNVPTQLTTDNSTLAASTAYVKNQGYAELAGTQTFTGVNTFNGVTIHNATLRNFQSTQAVFPGDFRLLDSTQTYLTQMYQSGTTCAIDGNFASSRIQISTRNASSVGVLNLVMENNNHVVLQGSASEIDILGTAVSLNGVCSFTNTTTPVITQTILTADNSTKIPTTAWVNSQAYLTASSLTNYMTLNTVQTATANKTFSSVVNMNELNIPAVGPLLTIDNTGEITQTSATIANNLYNTTINATTGSQLTIKGTANTAGSTIAQLGSTLQISAITNNTGSFTTTLTLSTRSSVNGGVVILNGNATNITMGGNSTNINLNSTNIICNGITSFTNVTTPTITQAITLSDNSTKIPTTAWVNGQGYALSSALSSYALLTPTANPQIFTGQQRFQSTTTNLPISVASTTGAITGAGGLYVATTAGQYNPIVKGNDLVLVGTGSAIDSASTKLTLTTHATSSVGIQMDIGNMTFDGGIIRQNSTFNCGYSYLATPLTVKGFYDIGYVWTIPYASFTGGAWATSAAIYNILTLAWDGTGNKRLGVWKVDVVIINTCTLAPSSSLCWNTISNVNRTINDTCVGASDLFLFGATGCQIMRMSFTINVVNLTTTYYLNSLTGGGAGLGSNTASNITFTRLA